MVKLSFDKTNLQKKSFGYLNTLKKSSIFKDVPKPNIINANAIGDINFAVSIKKFFNYNILLNQTIKKCPKNSYWLTS